MAAQLTRIRELSVGSNDARTQTILRLSIEFSDGEIRALHWPLPELVDDMLSRGDACVVTREFQRSRIHGDVPVNSPALLRTVEPTDPAVEERRIRTVATFFKGYIDKEIQTVSQAQTALDARVKKVEANPPLQGDVITGAVLERTLNRVGDAIHERILRGESAIAEELKKQHKIALDAIAKIEELQKSDGEADAKLTQAERRLSRHAEHLHALEDRTKKLERR